MWNHLGPVIFKPEHLAVVIQDMFEVKWVGLQIWAKLSF